MSNILITICARGGSKGIPGKNIKLLNNIPLLHYSLKLAYKISEKYGADIQVSTDSKEIIKCASELGYHTNYIRPVELATDKAGKIPAIENALAYAEKNNKKKYEYVLDLDVTSPLRTIEDIEQALLMLQNKSEALNIFSVNPSARSPYFNMVEESENGFVTLIKEGGLFLSRQDVPKTYDMNASFYIFRSSFFSKKYQTSITPFSMAYVMNHICFDLDHGIDFTIMELLLQNNLLDFSI